MYIYNMHIHPSAGVPLVLDPLAPHRPGPPPPSRSLLRTAHFAPSPNSSVGRPEARVFGLWGLMCQTRLTVSNPGIQGNRYLGL